MKRTSTKAIVIHTTASNSFTSAKQIQEFFIRFLKWDKGGYHTIYNRDGSKISPYSWKDERTNGILRNETLDLDNMNTIHLSYIGGITNYKQNEAVCNITKSQEYAIIDDIYYILQWYPNAKIIGHNQINPKYCPSFWVPDWAKKYAFKDKNIEFADIFNLKKEILKLPHPLNFYEK